MFLKSRHRSVHIHRITTKMLVVRQSKGDQEISKVLPSWNCAHLSEIFHPQV